MRSPKRTRSLRIPLKLLDQMPRGLRAQREVIILGLQQRRVKHALEKYRRGECTLAFAAQQAGVTLREIVPLAYAAGLEPSVDLRLLNHDLTAGEVTQL